MKTKTFLGLVAALVMSVFTDWAQPPAPGPGAPAQGENPAGPPTAVSPAVAEVIRLAQSGVGEDVVTAYIQNSAATFDLSADQILYLRDLGISSPAITAMLGRDATLRAQGAPAAGAPQPTPAPAPVPQPDVPVEAPLTPAPTEVAAPPAQVNYFYSDLSPYGTWVDLEGFGWCWQPSVVVVNHGWRPYCDGGHWVYSDCGWFWQSDYSWGWAAFHYGRWQLHPRCGWVWLPDTVWAPSWVVWRSYGDYCGWAPLPPHAVFEVGVGWRFNGVHVGVDFDFGLHVNAFTFVGLHDFCEHDLGHRRLPPTEVTRIYNRTTIINNYTVNNTTIINHGVSVDRVASVSRTAVPRATVRELPAGTSVMAARTRAVERGTPVVYKPQLRASTRPAAVTVQKVDASHPVIQHTPSVAVANTRNQSFGTTTPSGGIRRGQQELPRTTRPGYERPGTYNSGQPASRGSQSTPRTEPTPRTYQPPARNEAPSRSTEAAPSRSYQSAPRATEPATRNYQTPQRSTAVEAPLTPGSQASRESRQPGREVPTYRSESAPPASRTPERMPETSRRQYSEPAETRGANPHVYYPKSYQPTGGESRSESRSVAPAAPRQSNPPADGGNSQSRGRRND